MLRARSRSFQLLIPKEESKASNSPSPRRVDHRMDRDGTVNIRSFKLKFVLLSVLCVAAVYILLRKESGSTSNSPAEEESSSAGIKSRVPFVDRSILHRLAELETSPDPDEHPYSYVSGPQRPPLVTRIPEVTSRQPDICDSRPCRFLLPLRIGEQESKARIHFVEILQLAQRLDRILVLPNVGKSRIGACFKFGFESYYDLEKLTQDLLPAAVTVKMDVFRRWVNHAHAPSAQMVFLSAKEESQSDVDFFNDDMSIRLYDKADSLPQCVSRFSSLRTDAHAQLHIHLMPHTHGHPINASILDALTRPAIQIAAASSPTSTDPDVLVVSWDLRHRIFPVTLSSPILHYSPRLHALATALAPPSGYVMVHWRMESVPPANLPQCAHALVNTLTRLPASDTRTIWFASDYPQPIHGTAKTKSGTFRDVGPLHARAVGIFRDAFAEGGKLAGWEVVELTDETMAMATLEADTEWDAEFLEDAGVRAIVDKIIGVQATLFVSGTPQCSRTSSFTAQVIDGRRAIIALGGERQKVLSGELPLLQNVVEHFG
ncbi:hypothetical protein R3P38DRAFT_3601854 [Favolaschia claudopus]|uniref:Uncharacterized protein n=1 Tax=Favolaschia claudopus TaxID=2862362 RepID=A0AAW0AAF6_9AGAR